MRRRQSGGRASLSRRGGNTPTTRVSSSPASRSHQRPTSAQEGRRGRTRRSRPRISPSEGIPIERKNEGESEKETSIDVEVPEKPGVADDGVSDGVLTEREGEETLGEDSVGEEDEDDIVDGVSEGEDAELEGDELEEMEIPPFPRSEIGKRIVLTNRSSGSGSLVMDVRRQFVPRDHGVIIWDRIPSAASVHRMNFRSHDDPSFLVESLEINRPRPTSSTIELKHIDQDLDAWIFKEYVGEDVAFEISRMKDGSEPEVTKYSGKLLPFGNFSQFGLLLDDRSIEVVRINSSVASVKFLLLTKEAGKEEGKEASEDVNDDYHREPSASVVMKCYSGFDEPSPQLIECIYDCPDLRWMCFYFLEIHPSRLGVDLNGMLTLSNGTKMTLMGCSFTLQDDDYSSDALPLQHAKWMCKKKKSMFFAKKSFKQKKKRKSASRDDGKGEQYSTTIHNFTFKPGPSLQQLVQGKSLPCEIVLEYDACPSNHYDKTSRTVQFKKTEGYIEQTKRVTQTLNFVLRDDCVKTIAPNLPPGPMTIIERSYDSLHQFTLRTLVSDGRFPRIDDDDSASVDLPDSRDVTASRERMEFTSEKDRQNASTLITERFVITLENISDYLTHTVLVRERLFRYSKYRIIASTNEFTRPESNVIEFRVAVPPSQKVKVDYKVQYVIPSRSTVA